MRKKAVQQGRSERRGEGVSFLTRPTPELRLAALARWYVEPLSDARTPLADFFRILLGKNDRLLRIAEFFECGF